MLSKIFLTFIVLFSFSSLATQKALALTSTQANLKVAFFGDSGQGNGYKSVLNLVKSEGAHAVLHLGDFDYASNPNGFESVLNSVLGASFPYFLTVGNHDIEDTPVWKTNCGSGNGCYGANFKRRMDLLGVPITTQQIDSEMYTIEYKGLKFFIVGNDDFSGKGDATFTPFLEAQLKADTHTWKICAWHRTQGAMQLGDKGDSIGWGVYETCQKYGAIIATAHEHSYHRTKTLTSVRNQTVDPAYNSPNIARVEPGKTFAFVSGLGGNSIRHQARCLPTTYPYGCKGEWAKVYTSDQSAKFGALFITFNVDGDPNKARGYFKNINGEVVDQFDVTTTGSTSVPTTGPTIVPTTVPTIRPTTTPTPRPSANPTIRPSGTPISNACASDINQDGATDLSDYALFVRDFLKSVITNQRSDMNKDGRVDLSDYAVFVKNFLRSCSPGTPAPVTPRPTASIAPQNPGGTTRPSPTAIGTTGGRSAIFNGLFASGSWNLPASSIPEDVANKKWVSYLYNNAANRAGNFNVGWKEYTYPIYIAEANTPTYPVVSPNGNINGKMMPYDPSWQASAGDDGQIIVIDPRTEMYYDLWQLKGIVGGKVQVTNGSAIPNYKSYHGQNQPSRGSGIVYFAMLVTPEEVDSGTIRHALSMHVKNTGPSFVAPATKSDGGTFGVAGGVPMGTRFALTMTNQELDSWVSSKPSGLQKLARTLGYALRDYGWVITDSAGGATIQIEDYHTAGVAWTRITGIQDLTADNLPLQDLLDGLNWQGAKVLQPR